MKIKNFMLCGLLISLPAMAALSPPSADTSANPGHINDRAIFPNATINGQPATLMLDTGLTDSALSVLQAVRLPLQFELPSPDSGPFGITEPAQIVIGQQTFTEPFAISPSDSDVDNMDGTIGWPAIRDNILVFNPDHRTISAVTELPSETAAWLKLKIRRSTLLTLETRLPDGSIGLIVVDTGADMGVGLPSSQWKSWRATHPNAPSVAGHFIGVISSAGVGAGTMEQVWADVLTVDELTLTDVLVNEIPDVEANAFGNNLGRIVCTLGLEALARLDLVVDGKNGYAYLRPKPSSSGTAGTDAIAKAMSGLDWTVANSVHINEDSFLNSEVKFKIGKGDLDGAIADLDHIIAHNPSDDLAYANRGAARDQKHDVDGAIEDLTHALQLNPNYALSYTNRGADRLATDDLNGAISDLKHSIELNPNNADSFSLLGEAEQISGDFAEAVKDYGNAIDLNLDDPAYAQYTQIYHQLLLQRLGLPADEFTMIVSNWKEGWTKSIGLFLTGKLDEKALLTAAEKPGDESVNSQQCEALYYIGMMRLLKGDQVSARDFLQKCIATGEKNEDEYDFARAELARLDAAEKK